MNAPATLPRRMSVDEFLAWTEQQPEGRYELLDGEVIAMTPERLGHARRKLQMVNLLADAIRDAGASCEAFVDGIGFRIDDSTMFIPDVIVRCGDRLDDDRNTLDDPVIVVEVLSPSTQNVDLAVKLDCYFRVPSVHHYLIVRTAGPPVIHHRRAADGISTYIVQSGPLRLDPPGITLMLD